MKEGEQKEKSEEEGSGATTKDGWILNIKLIVY